MSNTPDPHAHLNKPVIFRKFARRAAASSHAALKSCWMILFAGGTFALLHSFDDFIDCSFFISEAPKEVAERNYCLALNDGYSHFLLSGLLFFVYILTFYRFYVGNVRVFDMVYDEVFEFIDSVHDKSNHADNRKGMPLEIEGDDNAEYQGLLEYSDNLLKWESFFLMATSLITVYLTVTPLHPLKFLTVYLFLLAFDVSWIVADKVWLSLLRLRGAKISASRGYFRDKFFEKLFPNPDPNRVNQLDKMFPSYALGVWKWNNFIFIVVIGLFVALYFWYHEHGCQYTGSYCKLIASLVQYAHGLGWPMDEQDTLELAPLWGGAGAAFLNCIVDLGWAREFYHPKFSKAHEIVVGKNSEA